MAHKFVVGQSVEYKPMGGKTALFKVVKQMPDEAGRIDFMYRIKSAQESFERNVLECDLSAASGSEEQYEPVKPLRRSGGH